jgi:branched-subunit amino acid transport protein
MNELLLITGMALVTFAIRYPMMVLVNRITLPPPLIQALRFVPVAVLTAIIFPSVLMPQGTITLGLNNAYLWGALATVIIAWRTRNLLLTIVLGMAFFLVWRAAFA